MATPVTRRSAGFTLIELLVTVVILSIMAFIASRALTTRALEEPAMSLLTQLLRLDGLAVLLFGAGFWYLVELQKAGRLDTFRLGHFLLLAVTYSLFFAAFGVLGANGVEPWLAGIIAGALSYPLVVLHTATIVDLRFALTAILPLTMLTTGIVINGVYGGELRSFVYLGMACSVVAFLTWSYPRFALGHEHQRSVEEQELADATMALADEANAARASVATARATLAQQDPDELASLRAWAERRLEAAHRAIDSFETMSGYHDSVRSAVSRSERRAACTTGTGLATRLRIRLPQTIASLDEALVALVEQRTRRLRLVDTPASEPHCIACGHTAQTLAQFCANCGTPSAERRQCPRCADVLHLPRHLLRTMDGHQAAVTHCHSCGERHAG